MTDQQLTGEAIELDHTSPARTSGSADRRENEAVIREALGVIDEALAKMMHRELVSSGEVADLLLDVRTLLTAPSTVEV
ncbi:MAG TPA: hypothetical protein VGK49_03970 [Ilumatobacteraceae bacterium]